MFETKYTEVLKKLKFDISNGSYGATGDKLPSFRELSTRYGVSLVTMSKTVNRLQEEGVVNIRGTSGAFIRTAVHSRRKSNDIAVIHKYMGDPAGALSIGMIEDFARAKKMGVIALKATESVQYLPELYTNLNADGLLFMHSTVTEEAAETLRQAEIPFVSLNRFDSEHVTWVDYDNEAGLVEALDFLLEYGCRRIADVNFGVNFGNYRRRIEQCYLDKLVSAGCFHRELFIWRDDKDEFRHLYGRSFAEAAGRKMASYLMDLPDLPDAIIVRDLSFESMRKEFTSRGIDILSRSQIVLVREDIHPCPPEVSLVLNPFEKKVETSFAMLCNLIRNPRLRGENVKLKPRLELKHTTWNQGGR